ncbi:A/G-specific adenine glycosylase [Candidatus Sumerlaeota bacterium]|nr:A/G-specific adenine glycosylase [Candidatus Sumerlaeota bacterium]
MKWYDRERRKMPWRENPSPYRTVVSEFMLQQTQVAAVIPYFNKFTALFRSFSALARAPEEQVLAAWSGLGYYRRARMLKRAAEIIVESYAGELPRETASLRSLPGFGDYTTAAVSSIAFDLPLAAVDGNVRRVLSRLFAEKKIDDGERASELAAGLMDRKGPGDWNQAMMELGATVCLPRNPRCGGCPAARFCAAYQTGSLEKFPPPKPQPRARDVCETAVALIRRGTVLLLRRGEGASFAAMWELPRMDSRETEPESLNPARVLRELTGLKHRSFKKIGEARSTFTHHKISTTLYLGKISNAARPVLIRHAAHQWARLEDLDAIAASKAQRRLFALIPRPPI